MTSSCATTPTRRPRRSTTGAPLMFFSWNRSHSSATVMSCRTVIGSRLMRSAARSGRVAVARARTRGGATARRDGFGARRGARAREPGARRRARSVFFGMMDPPPGSGPVDEPLDGFGCGVGFDDAVGARGPAPSGPAGMVLDRRLAELAAVRRGHQHRLLVAGDAPAGARLQISGHRGGGVRADVDAR